MAKKSAVKVNRGIMKGKQRLNLKQDRFCYLFVFSDELFNNGTRSYAEAYGYNIEDIPDNDGIYEEIFGEPDTETGKREVIETKLVRASSRTRALQVCSSESTKLLRKPWVQDRINEHLRAMATDEWVDSRLAYLMKQNGNLPVAKSALSEYNKLKGRITDKVEVNIAGAKKAKKKRLSFLDSIMTPNADIQP